MRNIAFSFFCLAILLVPINYQISGIRPTDVFFYLSFFTILISGIITTSRFVIISIVLVLSILLISNFIGIYHTNVYNEIGWLFIVKYINIYAYYIVTSNVLKEKEQFIIVNKIFIFIYKILIFWVFIYIILRNTGVIVGNFRPDFILTNDYNITGGHLYSAYLGFFLIVYIFYWRSFFLHNFLYSFFIITTGFSALMLTGSRGGVVILGLGVFISQIKQLFFQKKYKVKRVILLFIIILITGYWQFGYKLDELYFYNLLDRSIQFQLTHDTSSLIRVQKFETAISELEASGYIFGVGTVSAQYLFYDGIIAIILAHGGLSLLTIMVVTLFYIFSSIYRSAMPLHNKILLYELVIFYLILNMITEYIFVTRNAFPVLIFIYTYWIASSQKIFVENISLKNHK